MTTTAPRLAELLAADRVGATPAAPTLVEALAVLEGLKPAGRFTTRRRDAGAVTGVLEEAGLRVAVVSPRPEDWGYRHASGDERRALSERDVRLYYALEPEALAEVVGAEEDRDDARLGHALGYPACCIAVNAIATGMAMTDMVRVARSPGPADWRLNIFLTEWETGAGSPYYLVSHFPCHLACARSAAYAADVLAMLQRAIPAFAESLEALLRLPVLLRDELEPPPSRRHGNYGALIHGIAHDGCVVYDGWRPLRGADLLPEARLDSGGSLRRSGSDVEVLSSHTGTPVALLEGEHWQLVTF
jgi:hypothetical protein